MSRTWRWICTMGVLQVLPACTCTPATATGTSTAALAEIISVSPDHGPITGGTFVTITGSGFVDVRSVTIGGLSLVGLQVESETTLKGTTPQGMTLGAQPVEVETGSNGSPSLLEGFTYLQPPPVIEGIDPNRGPIAGGTYVQINGHDFTNAPSVTIGGQELTVLSADNILITGLTPAGVDGAQDLVVTAPSGPATLPGAFTYVSPPTVTSISPGTGPTVGGTTVTITGTNFLDVQSVTIGGQSLAPPLTVTLVSIAGATRGGTPGPNDVVVTTMYGSVKVDGGFTYANRWDTPGLNWDIGSSAVWQ